MLDQSIQSDLIALGPTFTAQVPAKTEENQSGAISLMQLSKLGRISDVSRAHERLNMLSEPDEYPPRYQWLPTRKLS
jgi:hypothetical protein